LFQAVGLYRFSTTVTVRDADLGDQQSEQVVQLGCGPHRGTGAPTGVALFDVDGRGKAVDPVHRRFPDLLKILSGLRRKALHITAMSFRVKGVLGKGGFPRAARSCDNHESFSRDEDVDSFEIVLAGALDLDFPGFHGSAQRKISI
jgi:hypothetical protein